MQIDLAQAAGSLGLLRGVSRGPPRVVKHPRAAGWHRFCQLLHGLRHLSAAEPSKAFLQSKRGRPRERVSWWVSQVGGCRSRLAGKYRTTSVSQERCWASECALGGLERQKGPFCTVRAAWCRSSLWSLPNSWPNSVSRTTCTTLWRNTSKIKRAGGSQRCWHHPCARANQCSNFVSR